MVRHLVLLLLGPLVLMACADNWRAPQFGNDPPTANNTAGWHYPPQCAGLTGNELGQCVTHVQQTLSMRSPTLQRGNIRGNAKCNAAMGEYRDLNYTLQFGTSPDFGGSGTPVIDDCPTPAVPSKPANPSASR